MAREDLLGRIDSTGHGRDAHPVELDLRTFFDADALRWYRKRTDAGKADAGGALDDVAFLRGAGLLAQAQGRLLPTRAAVLLFGRPEHVVDQVPRMIAVLKAYGPGVVAFDASSRFRVREVVEDNLVNSLRAILDFFDRNTDRPFCIDSATLQRIDDPHENASYREAVFNLLVHQDYARVSAHAKIGIFADGVEFTNPGNSFAPPEDLLDAGAKEARNPLIAAAFRRLGLVQRKSGGLPGVFENWRRLGYAPPEIENDKGGRTFRIRLLKERLASDERLRFMGEVGIPHPTHESCVFALLLCRGAASLADIKATTGLNTSAALRIAGSLEARGIATRLAGAAPGLRLSDPFAWPYAECGSAMGQASGGGLRGVAETGSILGSGASRADPAGWLTQAQRTIVELSEEPRSLTELMQAAGAGHRGHFKKKHLDPLIALGLVGMTDPDSPKSPAQKYRLTRMGLQIRQRVFGSG